MLHGKDATELPLTVDLRAVLMELYALLELVYRPLSTRIYHVAIRPDQDKYDAIYHVGQDPFFTFLGVSSRVFSCTLQHFLDMYPSKEQ